MPPRDPSQAVEGVRLLSHRPSLLFKIAQLAEGAVGDDASGGLLLLGPDWSDRLKVLLETLSIPERGGLFAASLGDDRALPLLAQRLLERERTDWFPEFLSKGRMVPHFQPIVDLRGGRVIGREALMRGRLGATTLSGWELVCAAEAHDALYSFDIRARAVALEVGLPMLPEHETLFINIDPRGVLDVDVSVRQTWPVVADAGVGPERVCLEIVDPESLAERGLLERLVGAHREQGGLISLDDLSGGAAALRCLEAVRPDFAKLDRALTSGIDTSLPRRRLVAALVEYAQELGCKVVAEGVERVTEFEAMRDLGVEYGQGYYFGHPAERPMEVDPQLFTRRTELV